MPQNIENKSSRKLFIHSFPRILYRSGVFFNPNLIICKSFLDNLNYAPFALMTDYSCAPLALTDESLSAVLKGPLEIFGFLVTSLLVNRLNHTPAIKGMTYIRQKVNSKQNARHFVLSINTAKS